MERVAKPGKAWFAKKLFQAIMQHMGEGKTEKGKFIKGEFGKKDKKPDQKKEPEKTGDTEQPYSGIGVAPKMKTEMLRVAQEIRKYIGGIKDIRPIPHELLNDIEQEWEGLNEYELIHAAEKSIGNKKLLDQSPRTYLSLAKTLEDKTKE